MGKKICNIYCFKNPYIFPHGNKTIKSNKNLRCDASLSLNISIADLEILVEIAHKTVYYQKQDSVSHSKILRSSAKAIILDHLKGHKVLCCMLFKYG